MQRLFTRRFASISPTIAIARAGTQPAAAPLAVKALSKTPAGVHIATVDDKGPVSSLAIVLGVGSRNDPADAPGAAHFLKNVLIRNLPGDTMVRLAREAEFRGNTLYTRVTREQLAVGSEFLRDDLVDVAPLLISSVFNPSFEPYEFLDAIPNLLLETKAQLSIPSTQIWEVAHRLAFRSGLGASLFLTPQNAGQLTRAHLTNLLKSVHPSQIAIVGTGINHSELSELVAPELEKLEFAAAAAAGTQVKSSYFGGEARVDYGVSAPANFLVALKSVGVDSPLYPASLVLEALLGGKPVIPYGGASGLLASAATGATSVNADLKSYSDIGLLGLFVNGKTADVKQTAQNAVLTLKKVASGSVGSADVAKAIKKVVAGLDKDREERILEVARDVIHKGSFSVSSEARSIIEKVTASDVAKVAELAVSSKPTVVASGNVAALPYADDIAF